jgi:hypothetical protein
VFLKTTGPTATVRDDISADQLRGDGDRDLFFANLARGVLDLLSDLRNNDLAIDLITT